MAPVERITATPRAGLGLRMPAAHTAAPASIDRDAEADPIDLRLDAADFVGWARGAAAIAIQSSVHRLI